MLDYRAFGYANGTNYYLAPAAQGGGVGDPNSYIFWDDIHPTAKTHALLATVITEQLNPEIPLGFAGTIGSAVLALQSLATSAMDARASQLAISNRPAAAAMVMRLSTMATVAAARTVIGRSPTTPRRW